MCFLYPLRRKGSGEVDRDDRRSVEENARHVVRLGLPPLAVPGLSPVIGISVCILGEICGNLFRFPESTREEREVFLLFAVPLMLFLTV